MGEPHWNIQHGAGPTLKLKDGPIPALKVWGGTEDNPALEVAEDGQMIVGRWTLRDLLRYWWKNGRKL
jgi:hypothetical protein